VSFFKQFPKRYYDIRGNEEYSVVTNIFRHVDVKESVSDPLLSYTYVYIQEGERPDQLSQRIYGTPKYYWTFFIADDNLKSGLANWPKGQSELDREVELEFEPYGALTILPEASSIYRYMDGSYSDEISVHENLGLNPETSLDYYKHVTNTLNGIDLNFAPLRVRRNGAYAKIHKWNPNTFQLILKDFTYGIHGGPGSSSHDYYMIGHKHPTTMTTSERKIHEAKAKEIFFGGAEDTEPDFFPCDFVFETSEWDGDKALWVEQLARSINENFQYPEIISGDRKLPINEFDEITNGRDYGITEIEGKIIAAKSLWRRNTTTDSDKFPIWDANGKNKLNDSTSTDNDIILANQLTDVALAGDISRLFSFSATRTYREFQSAPLYYIDEDGNRMNSFYSVTNKSVEDIISENTTDGTGNSDETSYKLPTTYFDAEENTTISGLKTGDIDRFKSYFQDLIDKNDFDQEIRVVRPEFIRQFADKYKELINS
jgi:hypothetical protein